MSKRPITEPGSLICTATISACTYTMQGSDAQKDSDMSLISQ